MSSLDPFSLVQDTPENQRRLAGASPEELLQCGRRLRYHRDEWAQFKGQVARYGTAFSEELIRTVFDQAHDSHARLVSSPHLGPELVRVILEMHLEFFGRNRVQNTDFGRALQNAARRGVLPMDAALLEQLSPAIGQCAGLLPSTRTFFQEEVERYLRVAKESEGESHPVLARRAAEAYAAADREENEARLHERDPAGRELVAHPYRTDAEVLQLLDAYESPGLLNELAYQSAYRGRRYLENPQIRSRVRANLHLKDVPVALLLSPREEDFSRVYPLVRARADYEQQLSGEGVPAEVFGWLPLEDRLHFLSHENAAVRIKAIRGIGGRESAPEEMASRGQGPATPARRGR